MEETRTTETHGWLLLLALATTVTELSLRLLERSRFQTTDGLVLATWMTFASTSAYFLPTRFTRSTAEPRLEVQVVVLVEDMEVSEVMALVQLLVV